MKRNKRIFAVITVALVLAAVAAVFLIIHRQNRSYSTSFRENGRNDTVIYGGKEYRYREHLSNYLFLGIDKRDETVEYEVRGNAGQADAVYLVSYDRAEKTVICFAVPRDCMTNIHIFAPDGTDLGYSEDHLTIQYAFGDGRDESCRLMKEAVSELFHGLPIQGYCSVNMDGIPAALEVLGDVSLVVPDDSLEGIYPEFRRGETVTITKDNAEKFVRYRDTGISQSAITRMNRQKTFLRACADKAKILFKDDPDLIVDMKKSIDPYLVTDIGNDVFAGLLEGNFPADGILDIPGEKVDGGEFDEYHIDEDRLYELILQTFYEEVRDD